MVAVTNSPFGQSTLPIVYSDVTCSGSETNILECGRKLHGTFECPTDNTAGVICSDGSHTMDQYMLYTLFLVCSDGDRLESEGTVFTREITLGCNSS